MTHPNPSMSDVRGLPHAFWKSLARTLAKSRFIALRGSPSAGLVMLARRLPYVLPPLTSHECADLQGIFAQTGGLDCPEGRPFRAPHFTTSLAGILGGGSMNAPRPGEISLAHNGVLLLDDYPEFDPGVRARILECPDVVRLARATRTSYFRSRPALVVATIHTESEQVSEMYETVSRLMREGNRWAVLDVPDVDPAGESGPSNDTMREAIARAQRG